MRRIMLALVAGAVLVGAGAPMANADRTDKPQGNATAKEWQAFGRDLAEVQATLALAEATVFGGDTEWRQDQCRFQSLERGTWTPREENLTATCVTARFQPMGGLAQFFAVATCESGMNRLAYNPAGCNGYGCLGLFQHHARYWPGRLALVPERWRVGAWDRWQNSRTQMVVTAKMTQAGWTTGWPGCA